MQASSYQDTKPLPFTQSAGTGQSTLATLACYRVISSQGFTLRLYKGGRLLKLAYVGEKRDPPHRPGEWIDNAKASNVHTREVFEVPETGKFGRKPRGKVRGFTRSSRMRLLEKFNALDSDHCTPHPKFITLTYPRSLVPSWQGAKEHLRMFVQQLDRRFGLHGLMWRMEQQEDGTLHFHLLYWYQPFLSWRWVCNGWDNLIGDYVLPEKSASTHISGVRHWRQAAYYVSKYIAKATSEAEGDTGHGRHWGTRNWKLMPVKVRVVALSLNEGYRVRRLIGQWRRAHGVRHSAFQGFCKFVPSAECGVSAFAPEKIGWKMLRFVTGLSKAEYLRLRKRNVTPNGGCIEPRTCATIRR
jgi:hypothetical protein